MSVSRVGPYRIVSQLGRGGMGAVYLAEDERSGARVALKVLLPGIVATPDLVRRFEREVGAATSIVHPNVARLLEAGRHEGLPFMALELVEGGSLSQRIARGGPLPWREALGIAAQVARGLAAAHGAGVVHRDVKPENVLLAKDGTPKVADFGLARRDVATGQSLLTRTGDFLGTPAYVAPEQADSAREVSPRADVYGLGATLYAMLTGRPPFAGEGLALLRKVLTETPEPPSRLVGTVPPAVDSLVMRLLAKDPAARGEAATVAAELNALASAGARGGRPSVALFVAAAVLISGGVAAGLAARARRAGAASPPAPTPSAPPAVPEGPAKGPGLPPWAERYRDDHLELLEATGPLWPVTERPVGFVAWLAPERIVSAGWDEAVTLWDDEHVTSFPLGAGAVCGTLLPDGSHVLIGTNKGTLALVDLASRGVVRTFTKENSGPVRAVLIDPKGRIAYSAGGDGCVRAWDLAAGQLRAIPHPGARDIWGLGLTPAGELVSADFAGVVRRIDPASGRFVAERRLGGKLTALAVSADGRRVLVGDAGCRTHVLDLPRLEVTAVLDAPVKQTANGLLSIAISPDSRVAVTGHQDDGLIDAWDLERLCHLESRPTHVGHVRCVAFSPDGRAVLSGGHDGAVGRWSLSEQLLGGPVGSLALSGERDCVVRRASGRLEALGERARPLLGGEPVSAVAGSRRGVIVARGPEVVLHDASTDRAVATLRAREGADVLSIAAGGDRAAALLAPGDRVELWDLATRAPAASRQLSLRYSAVALGPDGGHVANGGNGTIALWPSADPGDPGFGNIYRNPVRWLAFSGARELFVLGRDDELSCVLLDDRGVTYRWSRSGVRACAVSADGFTVATAEANGIHVLDGNGKVTTSSVWRPTDDAVTALALARDGREVHAGTRRGAVLRYAIRR